MSPDPLAGNIFDPQSMNRYAYVNNDPTNLVDPLGLGPKLIAPYDPWLASGWTSLRLLDLLARIASTPTSWTPEWHVTNEGIPYWTPSYTYGNSWVLGLVGQLTGGRDAGGVGTGGRGKDQKQTASQQKKYEDCVRGELWKILGSHLLTTYLDFSDIPTSTRGAGLSLMRLGATVATVDLGANPEPASKAALLFGALELAGPGFALVVEGTKEDIAQQRAESDKAIADCNAKFPP